jgi:hypothetical protein
VRKRGIQLYPWGFSTIEAALVIRSLEICDPRGGHPVGLAFISGAERSRKIGLAGMGRRQVRPELGGYNDPNSEFSVDDL